MSDFQEGHMNQGQINLSIRELQRKVHDLEQYVDSQQKLLEAFDLQVAEIEKRINHVRHIG